VGTLGFSHLAYEQIRNVHDTKERARELVSTCIKYAQFYQKDSDLWKGFNTNKSIDIADFRKLLEKSDVLLSEPEVDDLIGDINDNGDNIITKDELEEYLQHGAYNQPVEIFIKCLRSKSFLSNGFWFVGALGYATAYYSSGKAYTVGNTVRCICFHECVTCFFSLACLVSYLNFSLPTF